ncbi:integrase/recombinase XerD [Mucilaginibacter gracilis]|uniref:Integrase/recombinase XerD n=1 Tax=Mucilaginibacter gracilis TaxID=423350 RepID=A0A495J680_9SPHI|nr:tyrosine-type recombinase/integrase [Mucilaginibacter gracilis]RKR84495.1 integrase/recombinase XerD [Mucilaginibacter gracilis]RKR84501.1 integrase/recombinase XerD [Mucilaginibacter gracilis]
MSKFEEYLQGTGFKPQTVYQHRKYASYFLAWMAEQSLAIEQITYTEILDFADHLKKDNKNINLINRMMLAVRYYFTYLQNERQISYNPAAGISLKGTIRTVPHDLLEKADLEALYHSYEIKDERTHRNKVIIGMLVYQALTREELETIRPEHLRLREGKINVPKTGKQNDRILPLQPHQILDLQEYILLIRPKLQSKSERLFTGRYDIENLQNTLLHLGYALKRINPKYKHAVQVRQSVITEWLKEKDLRTVQYMAGHRYVSSTERYRESNLEELKEALLKHHPQK